MMPWREHIERFGTEFFPGAGWVRLTFIALFALAGVLRFWNYTNVPYTHDEISALVRIYPTLTETVERGVIELDTHPPGVQVFEWAWTGLFGMDEPVVKLPFTLMALAALFLLYRFALAWTSSTIALVLIAILATLQYTVMYAQIARPYAVGFFTTALLADQLTRYVAHGRSRSLIGVGIAALLSAYSHHFALLLAGLIAVSGLFLIRPEQRRNYLIMCVIVILLYLPNVPILLTQLGQGGLSEWLAPPDSKWVMNYAWWMAHCSWVFALVLGGLVLFAIVRAFMGHSEKGPILPLLLIWGITPLLIGLGYSIWRAPVIQYSVVLFSFPYLLLILLIGLGTLDKRITISLCALLALISTLSLIRDRRHFDVFYASKYESIVKGALTNHAKFGSKGTTVIDAPDQVIKFYQQLWNLVPGELPYTQLRTDPPRPDLDSLLNTWNGRTVFYGQSNGAPSEDLTRIQRYFPDILERHDFNEGQTFLFTDIGSDSTLIKDREIITENSPGLQALSVLMNRRSRADLSWDIHSDIPLITSVDSGKAWDMTGREYGILVALDVDGNVHHKRDIVEVTAGISGYVPSSEVGLVFELRHADSTVFYRTGELQQLMPVSGMVQLIVCGRMADPGIAGPIQLRAYLHNRSKGPLHVHDLKVYRRDANPIQYGLVEPIMTLGPYH